MTYGGLKLSVLRILIGCAQSARFVHRLETRTPRGLVWNTCERGEAIAEGVRGAKAIRHCSSVHKVPYFKRVVQVIVPREKIGFPKKNVVSRRNSPPSYSTLLYNRGRYRLMDCVGGLWGC